MSAGKHAQRLVIRAVFVMPHVRPGVKVGRRRGLGAEGLLHGDALDESPHRESRAHPRALAQARDLASCIRSATRPSWPARARRRKHVQRVIAPLRAAGCDAAAGPISPDFGNIFQYFPSIRRDPPQSVVIGLTRPLPRVHHGPVCNKKESEP